MRTKRRELARPLRGRALAASRLEPRVTCTTVFNNTFARVSAHSGDDS